MSDTSIKFERQIPMDAYKLLRSYIDEENKLLNYRMTWLLTINGFLFATYAIAVQKAIDRHGSTWKFSTKLMEIHKQTADYQHLSIFLILVSVLGLLICRNGRVGIVGARRAVFFIEKFVEARFDIEQLNVSASAVKYKGLFRGIVLRLIRSYIYTSANKMKWPYSKNYLNAISKQISATDIQVINCIYVKDVGLMPFITGGGYYKPARRTKMSSLMFVQFLFGVWGILLIFSIYMLIPSQSVCVQSVCFHLDLR